MYGAMYTGRECTGWGIETRGCNISPLGSNAKISSHGEIFVLDPICLVHLTVKNHLSGMQHWLPTHHWTRVFETSDYFAAEKII